MKNKEYTYDYKIDFQYKSPASIVLKQIKEKSRVLELGPSTGYITKYLTEELGCKVTCIEIDEEAAEIAKQYCEKMIVGNLDQLNLEEILKEKYDYVLMMDVLEHLYSPKTILRQITKFLNHDGVIWISVPNISHISIVQQLIENKFTYGKWGLLDNTHIRFFTRNTIKNLFDELDYEIVSEDNIIKYPEQTEFKSNNFEVDFLTDIVKEKNKDLYTYQMLFEIKPNSKNNNYLNQVDIRDSYVKQFDSKLYIDLGEGFNEKNTSIAKCNEMNGIFYVDFKEFDHIENTYAQNIRFDLLEDKFSYIKIEGISFKDKKNITRNIELNKITSNADLVKEDNGMYFLKYDSQIYINVPDIYLRNITIWGKCKFEEDLEIAKNLYQLWKGCEKKLICLENEIQKKNELERNLKEKIEEQNNLIKSIQIKIQERENDNNKLRKKIDNQNDEFKIKEMEIEALKNKFEKIELEKKEKKSFIKRIRENLL
ncbi:MULTISPECIES: class I SAM-dependent methyltransferase [Clostridium]|uniref:class I SAM-dependent methyltransferase n=1 Tax=Clostridium TaxID=1485 RepID=UPI00069821E4|nr:MULTISPECIES: class I SAM-dependent methyltransferase [Clostridium]MDB2158895.1 methyltransferase domain-containing protein [Clostridium butyricum]MDU1403286.1 methyltransferase domain-containing protein [Clostridium sp.]MDU4926836.1 methyltransferase domain-containing protein [Clostridium sp.]MZI81703.1 methyltransferase domain-containing protein [Clostridium butyricum]QUF83052.1 methyltransferase domain-containing protein [Clostridium butyricum]